MKKYVFAFVAGVWSLHASTWSTPEAINNGILGMSFFVNGVYDSSSNQVFAAWSSSPQVTTMPYYSIYTATGGWTTPEVIGQGVSMSNVSLGYINSGPNTGVLVTAFSDGASSPVSSNPVSFFYNSSWGPYTSIETNSMALGNVYLAYSTNTQRLYAAWIDSSFTPNFAVSVDAISWESIPFPVANPNVKESNADVTIACDNSGNLFAAWKNIYTGQPTYGIYDGNSWVTGPISATYNNSVQDKVFLIYAANSDQIIAAWVDKARVFNYAIYSSGYWSTPIAVSGTQVTRDVNLAYDDDTGKVYASWADTTTGGNPTYAVYDQNSQIWSVAPIATDYRAMLQVTLVYASGLSQMFALWMDVDTNSPFWSTLTP